MVGRPILRAEESVVDNMTLKAVMCGDEAAAARASLDCKYPVSHNNCDHHCILLNVFICRWRMVLLGIGTIWNICGTIHFMINYK